MNILFTFLALLLPVEVTELIQKPELVIWNVGQGQWASWIDVGTCLHFDLGGEKNPVHIVLERCQRRHNEIFLSHWDLDHRSFLFRFTRQLSSFCFYFPKASEAPSHIRQKVKDLLSCEGLPVSVHQAFAGRRSKSLSRNSESQVFYQDRSQALFPGDSTISEEKIWARKLRGKDIRVWVLGHHGSQTSTSLSTLSWPKRIRMAVASSRYAKYKHPHARVIELLRDRHIPLLKTEDWGNIHFLYSL